MSALEYTGVTLTVWGEPSDVAEAVANDANTNANTGWRLVSHGIVTSVSRSAGVDWKSVCLMTEYGYAVSVIYARRRDYDPNEGG